MLQTKEFLEVHISFKFPKLLIFLLLFERSVVIDCFFVLFRFLCFVVVVFMEAE